jgi:hypothetical protein
MKQFLLVASALAALIGPASAGTKLQLQFLKWDNESAGSMKFIVSLRNPTAMQFGHVEWSCEFYDKDKHVIGNYPLIFEAVPWGAMLIQSKLVPVKGDEFANVACSLTEAIERTPDNEWLYLKYTGGKRIGLDDPKSNLWIDPNKPFQGQGVVTTEEDDKRMVDMRKANNPDKLVLRNGIITSEKNPWSAVNSPDAVR